MTRWHAPERYELQKRIGFGSYGSVRGAYDRAEDRTVAIKRQKDVFRNASAAKNILREIAILTRVSHDNVVQLFDIYVDDDPSEFDDLYYAMELCDSDLAELMRRDVRLEATTIGNMMCNLFTALKYLHSAGIYHRDLKPANCLVNDNFSLKICDFGLARPSSRCMPTVASWISLAEHMNDCQGFDSSSEGDDVDDDELVFKRRLTKHVGTRWYRAPELILLQSKYTEKVDVWSAGCIYGELLELLPDGPPRANRKPLFPGQSCPPLSPRAGTGGGLEQLNQIFMVLGTPCDEDVDDLEDESSRCHVRRFQSCAGIGLQNMFQYATQEMQDFLAEMLVFNPQARISVDLALEHVVFRGIRNPLKETVASERIVLSFEDENHPDVDFLQEAFANELCRFRSKSRPAIGSICLSETVGKPHSFIHDKKKYPLSGSLLVNPGFECPDCLDSRERRAVTSDEEGCFRLYRNTRSQHITSTRQKSWLLRLERLATTIPRICMLNSRAS